MSFRSIARSGRRSRARYAVTALILLLPLQGAAQTTGTAPTSPPATPITPQPSATAPLGAAPAPADRVQEAVRVVAAWAASANARFGAEVLDVRTGASLAASGEHTALNPASNTKILTAAAVLDRFGPDYRFTTGLYGKVRDGTVSPLVIRGNGDPSLGTRELWELCLTLRDLGVRKVDGVLVDQSYFDADFVPPAFAQQPQEWAPFRAPVSAVAVERNTVTLNVVASRAGTAASAWFEPPGFVDVAGTVQTRPAKAGDGVRLTVSPQAARLHADVTGYVGEDQPRLRFSKRADDPRLIAGHATAALLRGLGVDVSGDIALGGEKVRERLASVESAPLGVLVRELGKNSDNFYAEMLMKDLGAFVRGAPAHSRDGADVVMAWTKDAGGLESGTAIVNGSGLFDANRVSTHGMATALRYAYLSPRIGADFVAQLAVGGVDGTLRSRFKRYADRRIVRAKSGTLDHVIALSGFVLGPTSDTGVAFSFIAEGVSGRHADARQRIDKCVDAIVAYVWKS
jgi:D-alanyl-D-alanine carboxypeptidase/D-alanyl-D-alanine-endopeptidase (penicillin-binding protein 4)